MSSNDYERTSLNVFRSPNDKKDYFISTLGNGIEYVVISNSSCSTRGVSSAALTVEVGSFDDPEEAGGLAHFLEHMVSLYTL
jgi:secreted Zn-dependent insulinase-like peptidase